MAIQFRKTYLLPAALTYLFATPTIAEPVFFIDTPALLTAAAEQAAIKYPELSEHGFLVEDSAVDFNCRSDGAYYIQPETVTQCLRNPMVPSPCHAEIKLIIPESVSESITAMDGGLCEQTAEYQAIYVEFYDDGHMDVRHSDFQLRNSNISPCSDKKLLIGLDELVAQHEVALQIEFSKTY